MKRYIKPQAERVVPRLEQFLIVPSIVTGDNGIGNGDDDTEGNGNPDVKERDVTWGNLW